MGLKNCSGCGKLMLDNPRGICHDCYAQEEQDELAIVEFLREKKRSSVEDIHKATGVKYKTIMRMIQEKRILSDMEVTYPCEMCGTPILQGRLCGSCNKGILDQIKKSEQARQAPDLMPKQTGMHTGFFKK